MEMFKTDPLTGQYELDGECVVCPVCWGQVNLRFSAWLDKHAPHTSSQTKHGAYVHYSCLSEKRLAEIAAH
jgi:hypothetical protein